MIPRVPGHAVALSPLVVLFAVTSVTIVLGGVTILLACRSPVLATIVDVLVFDKDPRARTCPPSSSRRRTPRVSYALRQRPKTRPPRVKPRPNVPTAKPPIATPLRHGDRRCQRPSASSSLGSAARRGALAQRSTGTHAEVEVVEDLVRSLRRHAAHCSLLRRCRPASSTCPTSTSARGTASTTGARGRAAGADRAGRSDARRRERRPHPRRPAGSTTPRPRISAAWTRRCSSSREPRHPAVLPGRFTHPWREFERHWEVTDPVHSSEELHVVGVNSVRPFGYQRGRVRPDDLERAGSRLREAPAGALRVVAVHHQLAGAPWRLRKLPLVSRSRVLEELAAAGAELIVGGHTHQAAICERREFEVLDGDTRSCVLATAPGLGRPRAGRRYEVRGVLVHRATSARSRSRRTSGGRGLGGRRAGASSRAPRPWPAETRPKERLADGVRGRHHESDGAADRAHRDVTTVMALLGDIDDDVARIRAGTGGRRWRRGSSRR